jgi:hypothetical protein
MDFHWPRRIVEYGVAIMLVLSAMVSWFNYEKGSNMMRSTIDYVHHWAEVEVNRKFGPMFEKIRLMSIPPPPNPQSPSSADGS